MKKCFSILLAVICAAATAWSLQDDSRTARRLHPKVKLGDLTTPPEDQAREQDSDILYLQTFDTEDSLGDLTVLDANEDGNSWKWQSSGDLRYGFCDNPADDYVILPALGLEAGKTYVFEFEGYNNGTNFPERIAGYVGTAPTAESLSSTCLVQPTEIKSKEPLLLSGEFTPEESGDYYFAVKACSDAMEYYLFTDNIKVSVKSSAPVETVSLPFTEDFTDGLPDNFKVINNNNDGKTWTWQSDGNMRYDFCSNVADDWLILPAMRLEGGKEYKFSTDTWCKAGGFPEKIAVYAGTSPDVSAMTSEVIAPTAISSTEPVSIDGSFTPETDGIYYFGVKACSDKMMFYLFVDNISVTEEETVVVGRDVPFERVFNSEESFEGCKIDDANLDGTTWQFDKGALIYRQSFKNDADDYFILPPLNMEEGMAYKVEMSARGGNSFVERVDLKAGRAPKGAAMTAAVCKPVEIPSPDTVEVGGVYVAEYTGVHYIAIHACSDANQFNLYVDRISVSAPMPASIPATVTDLALIPDPNGASKATLTFTAPALSTAGVALPSIDSIDITRDGEALVSLSGTPGQKIEYTDETVTEGKHSYTVTVVNASGPSIGTSADVFVGFDVPVPTESVTVKPGSNDGDVYFAWSPVTQDVNGLALPKSEVKYAIVENCGTSQVMLANDIDITEGTMQVCSPTQSQRFVYYSIFAKNAKGFGNGRNSEMIAIGAPFKIPYHQGFYESDPLKIYLNGGLRWSEDSSEYYGDTDGDGHFVKFLYNDDETTGSLLTGKIDLRATTEPVLRFSHYNFGVIDNNTYLVEIGVNGVFTQIDSFTGGSDRAEGWVLHSYPLTEYKDKTVQIRITPTINGEQRGGILDNITVAEKYESNLSLASASMPKTVSPGESFTVNARVDNYAAQVSGAYSVKVFREGEEIASENFVPLKSGESAFITLDVEVPALETEKRVYRVSVEMNGDEHEADNYAEAEVIPVLPAHPVPQNLTATGRGGNVELAWEQPDLTLLPTRPQTEDFEQMRSFSVSGGNGWKMLDVDCAPVGGFFGITVPNVPSGSQAAWFVLDSSYEQFNETFASASGKKCIAALYNANGVANDDWAVSPELSGFAQTITFKARAYSAQTTEYIAVMASSTGYSAADFYEIDRFTLSTDQWQDLSAYLPAGTKYFAIRYVSADAFMAMVDDITFATPDGRQEDYALEGYNVYLDNDKVNDSLLSEKFFTDGNNALWTGEYRVTAVYSGKGESAPSAPAKVIDGITDVIAGSLSVSAADGMITLSGDYTGPVTVSDAAGRIVFTGLKTTPGLTIPAARGIYIVKCAARTLKTTLR